MEIYIYFFIAFTIFRDNNISLCKLDSALHFYNIDCVPKKKEVYFNLSVRDCILIIKYFIYICML